MSNEWLPLAQDMEPACVRVPARPSPDLPEQVLAFPTPVVGYQAMAWPTAEDPDLMAQLAAWNRLESDPLPAPLTLHATTHRWHDIQPITPPLHPRHPLLSLPAPDHVHFTMPDTPFLPNASFFPHAFFLPDAPLLPDARHGHLHPRDHQDEEERTVHTPPEASAQAPSSRSDDVDFQCRLLLPEGVRCTESFSVAPNFSRSSAYAHHLAQAHLIALSAGRTARPWVCTLEGCKSRKATTVGILDPLTHIRTHLGRPLQCSACQESFGRPSSLKRHRDRYCQSGSERAYKRARARPGPRPFDCPDCSRPVGSADALFHHQMMEECVPESSK